MRTYKSRQQAFIGMGLMALAATALPAHGETIACDFTAQNPGVVALATTGCVIDGAVFLVPDDKISVGTGTIDSFLTTQEKGPATNFHESGFNSDNGPPGNLQTDRYGGSGPKGFTNSILLGDIPLVEFNGSWYREFLLDINQETSDPHLSLNALRLFGAAGDGSYDASDLTKPYNYDVYDRAPSAYDTTGRPGYRDASGAFHTSASLIWGLDQLQDNALLLDYALCSYKQSDGPILPFSCPKGSGRDYDIRWLVPIDLFAGFDSNDWILLYTSFGWTGDGSEYCMSYETETTVAASTKKNSKKVAPEESTEVCRLLSRNDGFEEWAIRSASQPDEVPEPGSLALLGLGLLGLGAARRRS